MTIFRIFFGSPLRRMQRLLRALERSILSAQITAGKDSSGIGLLQRYNERISHYLDKIRSAFLANANHYNKSASNRTALPQITATISSISASLKNVELEIESNKVELTAMSATDPAFVNAWLTELVSSYKSMLTSAEVLESLIRSLKDPDEEKKPQEAAQIVACSTALGYLRQGYIPTKTRELVSLARTCGYLVDERGNHLKVFTKSGGLVTSIPSHKGHDLASGTARQIVEGLATGTFAGRPQVQRARAV